MRGLRLDQRIKRHLDEELGVELAEDAERVAKARTAFVAAVQQRDERRVAAVSTQFAEEEQVGLILSRGRVIGVGHWTTAVPEPRRQPSGRPSDAFGCGRSAR